MKNSRREFVAGAACSAALAVAPSLARAQGAPQVNHEYRLVEPAQPTEGGGKVEVIEFFGYWCPHCAEFEPAMSAWIKRAPPDVAFRYVPVAFAPAQEIYSKFFYTLDAMGLVQQLHAKTFLALHTTRSTLLNTPEVCADFAAANGVDRAKFLATMNSFGVQSRTAQSKRVVDAYRVEGTPALTVAGRYYTAPSLANGPADALRTVDYLADQTRKSSQKG